MRYKLKMFYTFSARAQWIISFQTEFLNESYSSEVRGYAQNRIRQGNVTNDISGASMVTAENKPVELGRVLLSYKIGLHFLPDFLYGILKVGSKCE